MKIIRNAVWLYTVSIAMFLFSIFFIGVYLLNGKTILSTIVSLTLLIIALLTVLLGILYAAKEVRLGYKILRIETQNILYSED
jgi:1,4-dihydroxy-2-naphthoate octaprenyltransferase